MPLQVYTPAEQAAARDSAGSDLQYHLAEIGISDEVQVALYAIGITSLRVFAGLDESRAKVRECLLNDLGLDSADGMPQRLQVALLISAWEAARVQLSAGELAKVEAKAHALPRPVGATELAAMRKVAELKLGSLKGNEVPSKALIGLKLEAVEENEPKVEDLREVSSLEDVESEALTGVIDATSGVFRVRKGSNSIPMPSNPEGLRLRHRRIGLAWTFVASRHTNRKWLAGVSVEDYRVLSDYVLGARVADLTSKSPSGDVVGRVSWNQVLEYEFQVRKLAYELIRTGDAATISVGLKMAIKDAETRQLHLIDPMALNSNFGRNRGAAVESEGRQGQQKKFKAGNNQAAYKGKKKGKGKGKGKGLHTRTNAGDPICFAFNGASGCRGNCTMKHVCQVCLAPHSMADCSQGGQANPPVRNLPDTGSAASSSASGALRPAAGP